MGIINVDFDTKDQLLSDLEFCIRKIHEKKWENNEAAHQIYVHVMLVFFVHSSSTVYRLEEGL